MATMVLFAVLAGLVWPLTWGLVLSIFWIGALGGVPAVALNPRFRSNSAIIGSVTALGIAFIYIFVVVSQVQ